MHKPRKQFGQNFLTDQQIIKRLVDVIAAKPGQHLVEIGPGKGALTFPILEKTGKLDAIEIDKDLVPLLNKHSSKGTLIVHEADALSFDFAKLATEERLRVIGNLPYNISTPLIFHLLSFSNIIADMHFMLQKEVVDRMSAAPNSHHYGRLSVMVQYRCKVDALFDVPPTAFYPQPSVNSSIVRLVPYSNLPFSAQNELHFANLVKLAFSQRRKTLRNSLKALLSDADWEKTPISPLARAEQLSVADFVNLSNALQ